MAIIFFKLIVGFLLFDYVLERLLDYLNGRNRSKTVPEKLRGFYDSEKYAKAQDYEKAKTLFSTLNSTLTISIMLLILYNDGFAWLDSWVRGITENPILMALLFFGVLGLASDIISTPLSLYNTFVIEEKFGFNKTTYATFFLDKLKGWVLGAIIGGGLLALIVFIYLKTGPWFWLVAWGTIGIFTLFMTMFYSNLIVPLFNKQKPLEDGELRDKIQAFAQKTGFVIKNIFVMDGSKRSTKANAYFTGLGPKKRIVLFDTLINEHSHDELVAILAHEIGHYKKKHTLLGTVMSLAQTGLMLYILSLFIGNPDLSHALGAEQGSFHLGILVFGLLYTPISLVMGLLMNMISRKNEFAADRFAGEQFKAGALKEALIKLSVNHLSNLTPHAVYVFFYYSHPPLLERLSSLDKIK